MFNRVQSGSFASRCYAAGLKFQEGPHWITHAYQEFTGQSPPQALMDVTNKIEKGKARRRQTTPVGKLIKNLLYDTLKGGKPLQWGRDHEEDARQAYSRAKGTSVTLTHSGLVIDAEHDWLACSPDDLVQDSSVEPENQQGLVEYKCPYSARDTTVEEACNMKAFMATMQNNTVILKQTNRYYYQVQGQMAVCGKRWCDFVIWTPSSLSIERITFNPQFWQDTWMFLRSSSSPRIGKPTFSTRTAYPRTNH